MHLETNGILWDGGLRDISGYYRGQPLRIGMKRQLFLDDTLVEDRRGVARQIHQPLRMSSEPLLKPDRPWECGLVYSPTVLFDEERNLFQMWYTSFNKSGFFGADARLAAEMGIPRLPAYYMLYAYSHDGLNWIKPEFDFFSYGRFAKTNIVHIGHPDGGQCGGFQVFTDPTETDPGRKFKTIHKDLGGVCLSFSPDGVRWIRYEGNPVIPKWSDTFNGVIYDTSRKKWMLRMLPRVNSAGTYLNIEPKRIRHTFHRSAMAESDDLIHWEFPRIVLTPDEEDQRQEYDHMPMIVYGDRLIGLLACWELGERPMNQYMCLKLAWSNDGRNWNRLPGRPFFLPHGEPGSFDSFGVFAAKGLLANILPGELVLYYAGSRRVEGQHSMLTQAGIGAARMRIDGFVEMHAGSMGGYLLTKEFILEGDALEMNIHCDWPVGTNIGSYAMAEILEAGSATASEGFGMRDFTISTDKEFQILAWKGKTDLSRFTGKPVRLRIFLQNAGIFGFRNITTGGSAR